MHLVIDMRGMQAIFDSVGSDRGPLPLLKEIVSHCGDCRVTLALSDLYPATIQPITVAFGESLPANAIRIWHAITPAREMDADANWQRTVTGSMRDAFLASLRPDVILQTHVVSPCGDDANSSVGTSCKDIPVAILVVGQGSIANSGSKSGAGTASENRPRDWSQLLEASGAIFAPIPLATAEWRECSPSVMAKLHRVSSGETTPLVDAETVLNVLRSLAGKAGRHVSSRLCVEKTGIFKRRPLRILLIKPDHLGDFILGIPAMSKLRAKYPHATLDILVGSWNVPIAKQLNLFEQVFSFDFFRRKSSEKARVDTTELADLAAKLPKYDMAIDLRRQADSRILIRTVAADLKVGYQTLDPKLDDHLDILLPIELDGRHRRTVLNLTPMTLQLMRLVDSLPLNVNDYVLLPEIVAPVARLQGTVAIFPKAGTEVREWETDKLLELIDRLCSSDRVAAVHLFFVNEQEAVGYRFRDEQKINTHVGLGFSELAKILSSVSLCIANNSGGIHLAAYLGTPSIGIYSGHELASEWGPQFYSGMVIHRDAYCAPCHLGRRSDCPNGNFCLGDIAVDDVYSKALEILSAPLNDVASSTRQIPNEVAAQMNDDRIVQTLISKIARCLPASDKQALIQVAGAIAENHPGYRVLPQNDTFRINATFGHRSTAIEWRGFSDGEARFRWTNDTRASMSFYVADDDTVTPEARILLVFDTYRSQRIVAKFNGIQIFDEICKG